MLDLRDLPIPVLAACRAAGAAILAARADPGAVASKADGSPVTAADRAASGILDVALRALDATIPVICEEAAQDPGEARHFWLVDPLDGTREFLRGTNTFTVNVALIEDGRPMWGMIHAPARGDSWWGVPGLGAWRDGAPIHARSALHIAVLLSPGEPEHSIDRLRGALPADYARAPVQSLPGALKFCELAEGRGLCHPRTVPCHAWDSAAGQAILEGAGGAVWTAGGQPLRYTPGSGWRNLPYLAVGDPKLDWKAMRESLDGALRR